MRSRVVIIVVALVLGGLAALMAAQYLNSAKVTVEKQSKPVEVLVAQQDIPRGTSAEEMFEKKMVALEKVPQRFVSAGAISSQRVLDGQVLAAEISSGEQLTTGRFQYPSQAGLAYNVPDTYVAVAIPVDKVSGVSGLLRPGDNVALLASLEQASGTPGTVAGAAKNTVTKVLIPKARVLAVGQSTGVESSEQPKSSGGLVASASESPSQQTANTVTLALSPQDAEKVVFTVVNGSAGADRSVWLVLLPAKGGDMQPTSGQTMQTVLN